MTDPLPDLTDLGRRAYVFGLPTIDLHRILDSFALDPSSPEFKAPLGQFAHSRRLADPSDRSIVAMNVDTPYSYAWLDLRDGPVMLTLPAFEPGRYVAAELFDLYTYIVGYVSPRTNGTRGGSFLITGPGQTADDTGLPVFACPTQLCLVLVRTQLLGDADLPNVAALQDQMSVRPLGGLAGHGRPRLGAGARVGADRAGRRAGKADGAGATCAGLDAAIHAAPARARRRALRPGNHRHRRRRPRRPGACAGRPRPRRTAGGWPGEPGSTTSWHVPAPCSRPRRSSAAGTCSATTTCPAPPAPTWASWATQPRSTSAWDTKPTPTAARSMVRPPTRSPSHPASCRPCMRSGRSPSTTPTATCTPTT